jgi:stringent starvation protein B
MASTKPYLIRAIYEWCADEGFTPYLAVQVDERTRVPHEYVRDGQIVLNVGADATHQMLMGNEEISFQTRFNGASFPVLVPVDAVVAIYARENGQGMAFDVAPLPVAEVDDLPRSLQTTESEASVEPQELKSEPTAKRGAHLTRVK